MRFKLVTSLLLLSLGSPAFAGTAGADRSRAELAALARRAVSEEAAEAAGAIAALRSEHDAGLEAFLAEHADAIAARRVAIASANPPAASPLWLRLSAALDAIAQQKDDFTSQLYWFTDFEQAREAAIASGKPILSLRLLGRLDEDFSCANSRFFRLTLYSNSEIARLLKQRFILHWQSVRPVPRVTIDFGDGRKLERTLTGNSIHYVLDSYGRVVDALPGLYGPQAFLRELIRGEAIAEQSDRAASEEARAALLRNFHNSRAAEIAGAWTNDLAKSGFMADPLRSVALAPAASLARSGEPAPPRAEVAARVAVSKMIIAEKPVLRGISTEPRLLDAQPDDVGWARIAALHADDARLDPASRALIRSKNPTRFADSLEWQRVVASLERTIAIDTARNEYVFHRALHQWLAQTTAAVDLAALNERVYSELFLTPSSDKWLGLFPADSFTGTQNDGVLTGTNRK